MSPKIDQLEKALLQYEFIRIESLPDQTPDAMVIIFNIKDAQFDKNDPENFSKTNLNSNGCIFGTLTFFNFSKTRVSYYNFHKFKEFHLYNKSSSNFDVKG